MKLLVAVDAEDIRTDQKRKENNRGVFLISRQCDTYIVRCQRELQICSPDSSFALKSTLLVQQWSLLLRLEVIVCDESKAQHRRTKTVKKKNLFSSVYGRRTDGSTFHRKFTVYFTVYTCLK